MFCLKFLWLNKMKIRIRKSRCKNLEQNRLCWSKTVPCQTEFRVWNLLPDFILFSDKIIIYLLYYYIDIWFYSKCMNIAWMLGKKTKLRKIIIFPQILKTILTNHFPEVNKKYDLIVLQYFWVNKLLLRKLVRHGILFSFPSFPVKEKENKHPLYYIMQCFNCFEVASDKTKTDRCICHETDCVDDIGEECLLFLLSM